MDGSWGSWGQWSDCSTTCGEGQQLRDRICDNPTPEFGGSLCTSNQIFVLSITSDGTFKETGTQTCNDGNCPGQPEGPTTPSPTAPWPKGTKELYFTLSIFKIVNILIARNKDCPYWKTLNKTLKQNLLKMFLSWWCMGAMGGLEWMFFDLWRRETF